MALKFLNSGYFAGKVGIGTASPQAQLTLSTTMLTSPTTQIYLDVDGNNGVGGGSEIIFNSSASGGSLVNYNAKITGTRSSANDGSSDLSFFTTLVTSATAPAVRMTIKDSGNVGIGTTSPDSLLHVSADVTGANTGTITIEGRPTGFLGDDIATIDFHNNGSKRADIRMERGNAADDSQLVFSTSDTGTLNDALIINEIGNVGIGTGNPTDKLYIKGDNPNIVLYSDTLTGSLINFIDQTYQSQIMGSQGTLLFKTGGTNERMRIDNSGNVGIGTTSPNRSLHVIGQVAIDNSTSPSGGLLVSPDGTSNKVYSRTGNATSSAHPLDFISGSSTSMRIDVNGNVGIGTTSPDFKLDVDGTFGVSDLPFNTDSVSVLVADETIASEIITNGSFDTDLTDWTNSSSYPLDISNVDIFRR